MPSFEKRWRVETNTFENKEFINPIGDFDINKNYWENLVNKFIKKIFAKNSKSEPLVSANYISTYNKITIDYDWDRHVKFKGYDDPHLEEYIYHGENDLVKDLPYKINK